MNCKNCHTEHQSKFCPNCGQKTITKHSFRTVFAGISEVVELERGFFKTFYNSVFNSKKFLKDYINGKTKPFTNPILYTINLVAFLFILGNILISITGETNNSDDSKLSQLIDIIKLITGCAITIFVFRIRDLLKLKTTINYFILFIYVMVNNIFIITIWFYLKMMVSHYKYINTHVTDIIDWFLVPIISLFYISRSFYNVKKWYFKFVLSLLFIFLIFTTTQFINDFFEYLNL